MQAVIQRDIPLDYGVWKEVSPECLNFIRSMLTRDPAERLTAAEALQHDWFRHFGIGTRLLLLTFLFQWKWSSGGARVRASFSVGIVTILSMRGSSKYDCPHTEHCCMVISLVWRHRLLLLIVVVLSVQVQTGQTWTARCQATSCRLHAACQTHCACG